METMLLVNEMQPVTGAALTLVSVHTTSIQVSGIALTDAIAAVRRVEGQTVENRGPERDLNDQALRAGSRCEERDRLHNGRDRDAAFERSKSRREENCE